ncbi:Isocitrate dehydrogenase [NADP] [compost metagenome]
MLLLQGKGSKGVLQMGIKATLIPGDGIGPEIVSATLQILDAMGNPFDFDVKHAGQLTHETEGFVKAVIGRL